MEKRSKDEWYGKSRVKVAEAVTKSPTVRLVLQRNIILNYTGKVTGNLYRFYGAGSIVEVDERDVPAMLAKDANKRSCCSGVETIPYFQIVVGG